MQHFLINDITYSITMLIVKGECGYENNEKTNKQKFTGGKLGTDACVWFTDGMCGVRNAQRVCT